MAETEETAGQQAAGDRASRKAGRGGRQRGKRGAAGGDRRAGTTEGADFVRKFRSLSPAERAAIRAEIVGGGASRGTGTPKFSVALDAVAEEDAAEVLGAIDEGLEIAKGTPEEQGNALRPLQEVAPDVANAAVANSGYRHKDIAHSLRVAKQYLEDKFPDAAAEGEDDDEDDDAGDDGENR